MELKVKNKVVEIVFDYGTVFKIQKKLASRNADTGESNNDGVGNLFNNILNRNDAALVDLIMLAANKIGSKGITEDDAIKAIETWIEDNNADSVEGLFEEIQAEMVDSGFSKEKILKYIGNLETVLNYLEMQDEVNEVQLRSVKDQIDTMKNALS